MKQAIFDETISLEYPDDFYEMSEEEIKEFFGGEILRIGFRNVEKHVILSLGKISKSLLTFFASPKGVLAGAINNFQNNLKDYRCLEEFNTNVLSKSGNGVRFEYSASDKDVKQFCEMTVTKYKGAFYVIYCLSRLEDKKENEEVFNSFRCSLRIK